MHTQLELRTSTQGSDVTEDAIVPSEILRSGSGEPLFLFHGVTCSAQVWQDVVPLLEGTHEVFVPTALGHRGGPRAEMRPARISHVVDDAERCLDRFGFDRVHLSGNSMGGWVALELARRGRALSVCALSPAGAWQDSQRPAKKLRQLRTLTRATRLLLPLGASFDTFRKLAMRDNAVHGDRISRATFLGLVDDLLGCEVAEDLLATDESLTELYADCPVTLAWSEQDRIFPMDPYGKIAKERVKGSRFIVLDGVGHVPMLDDAELVAETILATTGATVAPTNGKSAHPRSVPRLA